MVFSRVGSRKVGLGIKWLLAASFLSSPLSFVQPLVAPQVVDLTGSNDSGTINGAQFVFTTPQSTRTGVIQPFLRLENSPVEQGYNTSGGTPFDDKAGPWTHDLTFGDLQNTQVTLGGASYFRLLLDVNEPGGSKSLISLESATILYLQSG